MWFSEKNDNELNKYEKVNIYVPFHQKDFVKEKGAIWSHEDKSWVIPKYRRNDFKEWTTLTKKYVNVPFELKDMIREGGGKWDKEEKKWYFENIIPNDFIEYEKK